MMHENNLLSNNISHLQQEQLRLNEVEEELKSIVESQGGNVEHFRLLVQENAAIVQRQKVGTCIFRFKVI